MIEFVAGLLLVSFLLCWLSSGLYLMFVWRRQLRAPERKVLNENLKKIGLFWSAKKDDFLSLDRSSIQREDAGFLRSLLIITAVLSLLSLPGFLIQVVFLFSIGFMARSRKEANTFSGLLVSDSSLSADQIRLLVAEINTN